LSFSVIKDILIKSKKLNVNDTQIDGEICIDEIVDVYLKSPFYKKYYIFNAFENFQDKIKNLKIQLKNKYIIIGVGKENSESGFSNPIKVNTKDIPRDIIYKNDISLHMVGVVNLKNRHYTAIVPDNRYDGWFEINDSKPSKTILKRSSIYAVLIIYYVEHTKKNILKKN
jgi:hypothetical protein